MRGMVWGSVCDENLVRRLKCLECDVEKNLDETVDKIEETVESSFLIRYSCLRYTMATSLLQRPSLGQKVCCLTMALITNYVL